jgi:methyl coenzyme M reductase subunit D
MLTMNCISSKTLKIEGQIMIFPHKQKPMEFTNHKLNLQEMLMGVLQVAVNGQKIVT